MQMPLHTSSSAETYIRNHEWRAAQLGGCPLHPSGGCSFARHGSYSRLTPRGMRIARWYCPQGHRTFSLLPDFLAARLPDLLDTIEDGAAAAGSARSMEAAADLLRGPDITLPSAVRWLRRRVRAVRAGLDAVAHFVPDPPAGGIDPSQPRLLAQLRRSLAPAVLADIPAPLGFQASRRAERTDDGNQHEVGPDGTPDARYDRGVNMVGVLCNAIPPRPPQLRPPPTTCSASGVPIAASRTAAPRCTCNGSAASEPTPRRTDWMNVPN
jgi:hypothetical protein